MAGSQLLPLVSVVVAVRNEQAGIVDCLESLLRMDYPSERRELLIVDNGSTDRTAEVVRRYPVAYLHESCRGVCHARNRGIQNATGEILALTDPDCVVSTGWLRELMQPFGDPGVGMVGGEIIPFPGRTPAESYAARRRSHSQQRPMSHPRRPFAMTPNVAVRREVFRQIGLFDVRFPGGGWEDADLSWRCVRESNFRLAYAPRAVVFHRYRTTARDFFVQQQRYGYGLALLRRKYSGELERSWHEILLAYRDLVRTAGALAAVAARRDRLNHASQDTALFDLLRQLGQTVGSVRGTLAFVRKGGSGTPHDNPKPPR